MGERGAELPLGQQQRGLDRLESRRVAGEPALWCAPGPATSYNGGPTVADLEGDGRAEVIARGYILDGVTGDVLATGVCLDGDTFPVVGDLDDDGVKEIVCGTEAWRADGSKMWSNPVAAYDYAALVDIDASWRDWGCP